MFVRTPFRFIVQVRSKPSRRVAYLSQRAAGSKAYTMRRQEEHSRPGPPVTSARSQPFVPRLGILYAAVAAAVLVPAWLRFDSLHHQNQQNAYRSQVQDIASAHASSIAAAVNKRLALLDGLYAFVESQYRSPQFSSDLHAFSTRLHASAPSVRAIEVIPAGVIEFVYPLAGNEAALGHDLNKDRRPEVQGDLRRARTTRRHTLTGPLELKQGGLGLIARKAVFRELGFWGYVTVILDVNAIVRDAAPGSDQIGFALRDSQGRIFYGDPRLFDKNPVLERTPLPDGYWELAALPLAGWSAVPGSDALVYRALAISLLLAICAVVYLVTERQYRLTKAVKAGEEQYRLITESVPLLICSFDQSHRCRFANRAFEGWFGLPQKALIGTSVRDLLGDAVADCLQEHAVRLDLGSTIYFDAEIPAAAGQKRQTNVTCMPQFTEQRHSDGFYLVAADITDRKTAELELRRSQSQLARAQAIAHVGS